MDMGRSFNIARSPKKLLGAKCLNTSAKVLPVTATEPSRTRYTASGRVPLAIIMSEARNLNFVI